MLFCHTVFALFWQILVILFGQFRAFGAAYYASEAIEAATAIRFHRSSVGEGGRYGKPKSTSMPLAARLAHKPLLMDRGSQQSGPGNDSPARPIPTLASRPSAS